ncbi:uncharacterized protein CcaverHIS019_0408030 [Cutaneotrichosporon cavernicola]|uniref:Uncharacterized protein n=1 Tax=Cutaneotrichosporon cavernicola TaxID=279322 RepID=A0AA48QW37_9TREE|nr:uncharacterized protein CcaverHIS019_0408030 [Cutaneotrichosporon cavernicola]BEI91983.1 hypothetical protein CcaverHIS019_0408030 [Cutaneotrichosporon cavernicola]
MVPDASPDTSSISTSYRSASTFPPLQPSRSQAPLLHSPYGRLSDDGFAHPFLRAGTPTTAREEDVSGVSSNTTDPATPRALLERSLSNDRTATPVGLQVTTLAFLAANVAELSATVASLADSVNGMRAAVEPKTLPFLNSPIGSLGLLTTMVTDALAETRQMNEANTAGVASLSAMLTSLLARVTTVSTGMESMRTMQQHTHEVQSTAFGLFQKMMEELKNASTAESASLASLASLTTTLDEMRAEQSSRLTAQVDTLPCLLPTLNDILNDTKHTVNTFRVVEGLREDHNTTAQVLQEIIEQTKPVASLAADIEIVRLHLEKRAAASQTSTPPLSGDELSPEHAGTTVDSSEIASLTSALDTMRSQLENAQAEAAEREMILIKEKDKLIAVLANERQDRSGVEANLRHTITELGQERDGEYTTAAAERAARAQAEADKTEAQRKLSEWMAGHPAPFDTPQPTMDAPQIVADKITVDKTQSAVHKPRPVVDKPRPLSAAATSSTGSAAPFVSTEPSLQPSLHSNKSREWHNAPFPPLPQFPNYRLPRSGSGGRPVKPRDGYTGRSGGGYLSGWKSGGNRSNYRENAHRAKSRESDYDVDPREISKGTNPRDARAGGYRANKHGNGW